MKRKSVPKLILTRRAKRPPTPAERALKTYEKTGSAEKAMAVFRQYGGRAAA